MHFCLSVFTNRSGGYRSSQKMVHQLGAVADAQYRNPQFKYAFITGRRIITVYAVRAACKNNALGILLTDLLQAHGIGVDFTVNVAFPDSSGDQLVILPAEVQDNH